MKSRVVIIGANGYLAKHVAKELLRLASPETILIDVNPPSQPGLTEFIQWDVRERSEHVVNVLKEASHVFFFAGLTGTVQSIERYSDFVETNEIGLLNLLEMLRTSGSSGKVVFPSTRLVYKGKEGALLKEDDEKEFKTIYALNKFACENYLKIYHDCFGIPYTVFRICVPYGSAFGHSFSYGSMRHFFTQAMDKKNVVVYGNGAQKRTFTHVSDIARIIVSGSLNELTNNDVFNIGGPDQMSIFDLASTIAEKFDVGVDCMDWTPLDKLTESGDTMFDSSKLNAIVSPNYEHSFHEWISTLHDLDP